MIIFIKGPLNVLNYFIDCMAAKEETSIILDMTQPDQMIKMINKWDSCINSSTIVITFNNIGIFLTIKPHLAFVCLKSEYSQGKRLKASLWHKTSC